MKTARFNGRSSTTGWCIGALGAAAARRHLDGARHAGRRVPRSDGADGHDPHRGARHGARRDGVAGHVPASRAPSTAPRACAACVRRRRSASPSSGSSSTGAPTSSWRGRSSPRSWRSSAARCRRRSSGRCSRRSRRSWARSCSSRSRPTRDDPLTLRTVADTVVRRRLLAVAGVSQVTPIGGAERQYPGGRASRSAARQRRLAHRAARRGPRRQPEHLGRRSTPRARRSTCCRRSAASAARRRSARASWRCAAGARCSSATSPTSARAAR